MGHDTIVVLDFGSQYSKLITRRIRELGVYSALLPYDTPLSELEGAKGIILSGGPASVYERGAPRLDRRLFGLSIPILGICYGMQLLSQVLGGEVRRGEQAEYGRTEIRLTSDRLFTGLPRLSSVWMSHGDTVHRPPAGFHATAHSSGGQIAAITNPARTIIGLQFHPEVHQTSRGRVILARFVFDICGAKKTWRLGSYIDQVTTAIRRQVGDDQVIAALSGGIDSAVTASLVHRAVGTKLQTIFVDQGTLRAGEVEQVLKSMRKLGLRVRFVDGSARFLRRLRGVVDPEAKRKIIGHEFVKVFERVAQTLTPPPKFFAQGTLYPDVIESAMAISSDRSAHRIKTHHNVGGLPRKLRWQLIEPLRELFKDEVRQIGQRLGLPSTLIWRQPFPGPGLAIRVIGEVTRERLELVRAADRIVGQEIEAAGLERRLWQYFAVLLNERSVGVVGDQRAYGQTIAVRIVRSRDGMTADWARLPPKLLERISTRITNEVTGVNRVVYDITSKPPGTIEWE